MPAACYYHFGFTLHATNNVIRLPTCFWSLCFLVLDLQFESLGCVPHCKLLVPCHDWTWEKTSC